MPLSKDLEKEIQKGLHDNLTSIPVQYDRVGEHIEIAKNTYYVIGGESGVGKSTITHEMFCIHPIEWYLNNMNEKIKLSVIGFFMERRQFYYSARWVSRMLFLNEGIHISPDKILKKKGEARMTAGEHEIVKKCYKTFDEWEREDLLIIHETSKNPSGISLFLEMFCGRHGKIHKKDTKAQRTYENVLEAPVLFEPDHPNHIILVITDNLSALMSEGDGKTKTMIDLHSKKMREARDWYGMCPVVIQHLNRQLSDIHRQKMGEMAMVPKLADFAGSSQTQNDADIVMAIYNPFNHANTQDTYMGFNMKKMKGEYKTWFRSLHLLKNSFGSVGMNFPMAFHETLGIFKTLPRSRDMTEEVYEQVLSGSYFLPGNGSGPTHIVDRPFKGF